MTLFKLYLSIEDTCYNLEQFILKMPKTFMFVQKVWPLYLLWKANTKEILALNSGTSRKTSILSIQMEQTGAEHNQTIRILQIFLLQHSNTYSIDLQSDLIRKCAGTLNAVHCVYNNPHCLNRFYGFKIMVILLHFVLVIACQTIDTTKAAFCL